MASADTQKLNNRRRREHTRRETIAGSMVSRAQARQLDFYQAMSDFKHMFPSMDEEVIEAVLRANDGAVDATIDQLLTMSVDNEEANAARRHVALTKRHTIAHLNVSRKVQDSPPSYSEAMRLQQSTTPPPLSGHSTWNPNSAHKRSLSANNSLLDMDLDTLSNTTPKTVFNSSSSQASLPSSSLRVYRNWNPPLLGTLPDDFLRLTPSSSKPLAETGSHKKAMHRSSRAVIISTHEFSKSMLQQKLKENERRRRSTSQDLDPELTQYLNDERLAIMLQNSEFLQELRGNEDFMKTLEKDRMNAAAFEPVAISPTKPNEAEMGGYGVDNQETLGAFPFSQPLHRDVDEDAELRRQLKHMGRASRKQFAALARKFFSRRKKKSSREILSEKIAPSMTNLLEDEDEHEDDPHGFNDRPEFEPLPSALPAVPSYKTVQRLPYQPQGTVVYHDRRKADIL